MPRTEGKIIVTVIDNGAQAGKRSWTVKLEAGAAALLLSDTLAKEGAINSFEKELRAANRAAISAYVLAGKRLIKEAGSKGNRGKSISGKKGRQDKTVDSLPS